MNDYFVLREKNCPDCHGSGRWDNPVWADYRAQTGGDEAEYPPDEWAQKKGLTGIGPEKYSCARCHGQGMVNEKVPLAEALAACGVHLMK